MTSEILLCKDLIDVKAHNHHRFSVLKRYLFVLVCLLIELHWNFKVCFLYFFFQNSSFQIGGVAYLQYTCVCLTHGILQYINISTKITII